MPVGRRRSVWTSHSCNSLRRTFSPAPPSKRTLSGTTTAARPGIFNIDFTCWPKLSCLLDDVFQKAGGMWVVLEGVFLVLIGLEVVGDVGVGRKEKAGGATGRVSDDLTRLRAHAVHQRVDQGPWREILPRTALGILGVTRQQALVGVTLD